MKILEPFAIVPSKKITVVLAEDHRKFRQSVRKLVESEGDITVVGEAKNGREAVCLAQAQLVEVVIMDIAMPILNGMQATLEIMEKSPLTRVLILSANMDPEYVQQAMKCGASGYLIKQTSMHLVLEAVREVVQGNYYLCSSISSTVRGECRNLFEQSKLLKKAGPSEVN